MLLAIAADANKVDEMINSPEIKPTRPVINIAAVKISFWRSFMGMFSYKVERFFYYNSTIQKTYIVDNNTVNIFIISLLYTIDSLNIHIDWVKTEGSTTCSVHAPSKIALNWQINTK